MTQKAWIIHKDDNFQFYEEIDKTADESIHQSSACYLRNAEDLSVNKFSCEDATSCKSMVVIPARRMDELAKAWCHARSLKVELGDSVSTKSRLRKTPRNPNINKNVTDVETKNRIIDSAEAKATLHYLSFLESVWRVERKLIDGIQAVGTDENFEWFLVGDDKEGNVLITSLPPLTIVLVKHLIEEGKLLRDESPTLFEECVLPLRKKLTMYVSATANKKVENVDKS